MIMVVARTLPCTHMHTHTHTHTDPNPHTHNTNIYFSTDWQDLCNGRGWCNCGHCSCFPPFFGTHCELCSGSKVCIQGTCDISGPNGICTECVVELLDIFHTNNVTVEELLTESFVQAAIRNKTLPAGSVLRDLNGEKAIFLPESFSLQCNVSCTPQVIINQSLELDYDILGQCDESVYAMNTVTLCTLL